MCSPYEDFFGKLNNSDPKMGRANIEIVISEK